MKKIFAWLILSSKNPQQLSLTIKGVLVGAITYVVFFAGLFHITLSPSDLTSLVESIVQIIEMTLTLISIVATAWGFVRKIYTSITGQNKVLNNW